jgi:hypothetical protein
LRRANIKNGSLFDRKTGDVHLVISDHLDWDENEGEHLLLLQHKVNTYLAFVEGGQLYVEYPRAAGNKIIFYVMAKISVERRGKQILSTRWEGHSRLRLFVAVRAPQAGGEERSHRWARAKR